MINIKDFTRNCRCDINRCSNKATRSIGEEDGPLYTRINICDEHLEQIVKQGAEIMGLQLCEVSANQVMVDDLVKQLEAKDATIEMLQNEIDNLKNEQKAEVGAASKKGGKK